VLAGEASVVGVDGGSNRIVTAMKCGVRDVFSRLERAW
jgi:hypothetical protein